MKRTNEHYLEKNEIFDLLKDPDLFDFISDFYQLLAQINNQRKTNRRRRFDQRLEAISRLLVGDETCVALAFDGKQVFVSTNENNHKDIETILHTDISVLPGSSYQNLLYIRVVAYLELKIDGTVKTVKVDNKTLEYKYNHHTSLYDPPEPYLTYPFSPGQHKIAGMAEFGQAIELPSIPGPSICSSLTDVLHLATQTYRIPINPLRRRTEILFQYLALFAHAKSNEISNPIRQRVKGLIPRLRTQLLTCSLSWEASKWYGKSRELKDFGFNDDKFKELLDQFIEIMLADFQQYKLTAKLQYCSIKQINQWAKEFTKKIRENKIHVPPILGSLSERIIKTAKSYFEDLENLETLVISELLAKTEFSKFLKLINPWESPPVVIIDDLEDDVHAEMRIFWYFQKQKRTLPFIAIGKLCCAHCYLVMEQNDVSQICGNHGKAYPKWRFSDSFRNDTFLAKFFGTTLFSKFKKLEAAILPGRTTTKAELALSIIESIGVLDTKDLESLHIAIKSLASKESNESEHPVTLDDEAFLEELSKEISILDAEYTKCLNNQARLIQILKTNLSDYQILTEFKVVSADDPDYQIKLELYELTNRMILLYKELNLKREGLKSYFDQNKSHPAVYTAIIEGKEYTFKCQTVEGDGWCALNSVGIENPLEALNELQQRLDDSRISRLILQALENNIHAIRLDEPFGLVEGDRDAVQKREKVLDLYWQIQFATSQEQQREAYINFLKYISQKEILQAYIQYLKKSKYVDENIAAACLALKNKTLAVFHNYLNNGQLSSLVADNINLTDADTVCIVLHPCRTHGLSHYDCLQFNGVKLLKPAPPTAKQKGAFSGSANAPTYFKPQPKNQTPSTALAAVLKKPIAKNP